MSESEIKHKIIGIIGGMGPLAGVELHKRIIEYTKVHTDQEHLSIVHISKSIELPDRTEFLQGKIARNPGTIINQLINEAKSLGAEIFAVPCNSAHNEKILSEYNCAGLINILEATVKELKAQNISEIGFIGTQGSHKNNLYSNYLKNFNIKVKTLSSEDNKKFIHNAIYDKKFGIKAIGVNSVANDLIIQGISKLGSKKILLGCTELSLVKTNLLSFNIIDPLDALAKELIYTAKGKI